MCTLASILLAVTIHRLWYALPLVLSVSLVYAATRHERIKDIVWHALGTARWIIVFMLIVLAILYVLTHYFT